MTTTSLRRTLAMSVGAIATATLLTACSSGPDFTCGDFNGADTDGKIAYGQEVVDDELDDDEVAQFPDEETAAISLAVAIDAVCLEQSDDQRVGDIDEDDLSTSAITDAIQGGEGDQELLNRLLESQGVDPSQLESPAS